MLPPFLTPGFLVFALAIASSDGKISIAVNATTHVDSTSHVAEDSCLRPADQMWLVSTRHLSCPDLDDPSTLQLDIRRYEEPTGWHTSSLESFNSAEPALTVVYVHGNRTDWCDSFTYGWKMYHAITSCCGGIPPVRFVIWSWPSDRIPRPLRDIRVKADRADVESLYLGWFMSQLKPETHLSLFGFSYGSRAISGGLQVLADGELDGQQLPEPMRAREIKVRVAYLAPAIDTGWLYPGNLHGDSLQRVDKMLILYNSCDSVLKRYRFVRRGSRASALGYTGLNIGALGEFASRVEQYNVASYIGRSHEEDLYIESAELMQDVCRIVLWQDPVEQ